MDILALVELPLDSVSKRGSARMIREEKMKHTYGGGGRKDRRQFLEMEKVGNNDRGGYTTSMNRIEMWASV